MQRDNSNANTHMPWNPTLYGLLKVIAWGVRRHFKVKESVSDSFKEQLKSGPMLIVCNHASNLDFAYFLTPFKREKVNFVVAENMKYSSKLFAFLFKHYHIIHKKQFYADLSCIKNIKKYLDDGISVIICPEGKETSDGQTSVILPSIIRLIKMMGYPVGSIKIHGTGLIEPKWGYTTRKGPSEANCDMLFTLEDLKNKSNDELFALLMQRLSFNEHEYQISNGYKYSGKRYAEGLQNILYRCPVCGEEFRITAKDYTLKCEACSSEFKYNRDGSIESLDGKQIPNRVDVWSNEEKNKIFEEIKNEQFFMEDDVELFMENQKLNGYSYITKGHIYMDKKKLVFDSEEIDENNIQYLVKDDSSQLELLKSNLKHMEFDLKNYSSIANIPGYSIDMCDSTHAYRFVIKSRPSSAKYALVIEALARE